MKLQLINYGKTMSYETAYDDVNLEEYFDAFEGLLVQATFNQKNIREYIIELGESYKEVEQEESFAEWLDSLKCSEIDTNDYDMYIKHTPKELLEIFKKSNA